MFPGASHRFSLFCEGSCREFRLARGTASVTDATPCWSFLYPSTPQAVPALSSGATRRVRGQYLDEGCVWFDKTIRIWARCEVLKLCPSRRLEILSLWNRTSLAIQNSAPPEAGSSHSKHFVHSKSSQYRRLSSEWKGNVYLAHSRIQVNICSDFFFVGFLIDCGSYSKIN